MSLVVCVDSFVSYQNTRENIIHCIIHRQALQKRRKTTEKFCWDGDWSLLNPIAYGILRLSQLRGGGFLSHTPENNVKIIWLGWNLLHIINGIRLLRMRNFRKFAVLFLEVWRHKIRLFTRERFIAFRCLPSEFVFIDAKITFLLSKMIFLT